jgi:hypothetical protein
MPKIQREINAVEKYGLKIIGQNWQSMTDTTEFGPTPFMPVLPFTPQPIADQWQVDVNMLNL